MHARARLSAIGPAIIVAMLTTPPSPVQGRAGDVLPFNATERTLPNGLKVIVVPTGFPNLISIEIPVQVGSRNEPEPGRSGFAHFFEHLMFRGTPDTPPARFRQVMSKAGARDNAGTGDDTTHYYATFSKDSLEEVVALYADMFQHLSVSEADFKTEARAVLGEYNKNAAEPTEKLFEVQREHFFRVHTYKHTTMGFVSDIEKFPDLYDYSRVFFERWYAPQYTTVVIAGDVAADRVLPIVEKYWGGWKTSTPPAVTIPKEPPPAGPLYAHVPWPADTPPYVTVAFPSPAFSETTREWASMQLLAGLYFGPTSELYKKLLVTEQKVDVFETELPRSVDPSLFTVLARVKDPADAVYVRDQILATIAASRAGSVPANRLAEAKSHDRYSFARTLDSTERIAAVVSRYAAYGRAYDTVNQYYRTLETVTAADLQSAARRYFTDAGLIVTTLSKAALPPGIDKARALDTVTPAAVFPLASVPPAPPGAIEAPKQAATIRSVLQKSVLPQLSVKLLFAVGSAHDPAGKEGLAALTAAMIARAGSRSLTIDQIDAVLYPMAGSFVGRADKELTTFTATVHRDHWAEFLSTVLAQLVDPGFRAEDFRRVKTVQMNALVQDLRSNNEEELGKERLQVNLFRGTPYGHVALGTVAGLDLITIDDVKRFASTMYTTSSLTVGVSGDAPPEMIRALEGGVARLPTGPAAPRVAVEGRVPSGIEVEIVQKDTRSTAISFGFPIEVTRTHPDFAALSVARAWLGEHRISSGRLYQRLREVRGFNYGDYAYIEAFPRGMFQFYPDPNTARQRQIFEIWIRPVVPANAHMALRIAIYELQKLVDNGLTPEQFETARGYLMNNVYVMTARQDQQLGYALDARWYGTDEFTSFMRGALQRVTLDQVNAAVRRHLGTRNLSVVCITKDAEALKDALVSDRFSAVHYDAAKPADVLAEDQVIGAMKLAVGPERARITPVAEVFAR
jgi:zinc protease